MAIGHSKVEEKTCSTKLFKAAISGFLFAKNGNTIRFPKKRKETLFSYSIIYGCSVWIFPFYFVIIKWISAQMLGLKNLREVVGPREPENFKEDKLWNIRTSL